MLLMKVFIKIKALIICFISIGLCSCATGSPLKVHQEHLDAWIGLPTEALETHSLFLIRPPVKTMISGGVEVWHYVDGVNVSNCQSEQSGYLDKRGFLPTVKYQEYSNCVSKGVTCNTLAFIKDNIIKEVEVVGPCYTSDAHLPNDRYRRMKDW